jgi:membrane protease YdiL (CAAX protease family)
MNLDTPSQPPLITKKKQLILFFLGWIGLLVFAIVFSALFAILLPLFLSVEDTDLFLSSEIFFSYVNFLTYLLLFFIGIILIWPFLRKTLIPAVISGKWWLGLPFTFAILFSSFGLVSLYDLLGIELQDNENQAAIVTLVNDAPLISLITFGLLGPIVEEWTYRLGLFQYLRSRSRWIAYVVTLTIFGFIHFNFATSSITNELLNLPIYLVAGAWFCFLYDRFGLQVAMSTHIVNNVLSVLSIFISSEISSSLSI